MRVIVLLAILGTAVAVPKNIGRIVGGNDTNIETFSFMANLQYSLFGLMWVQGCGGSLITPNTVLTAAHCVEGDLASGWRVALGTSSRGATDGIIRALARIIMQPNYNVATALDADVALLHLATSAPLSNRISTIAIASAPTELAPGLPVTTIGWGTLSFQGPSPDQLQYVDISIIDQNWCAQQYRQLKQRPGFGGWPDVTGYMACAAVPDGGKDACQGDSGGPVIFRAVNPIQVGITSWGYQCGLRDFPGVLARIPPFTNWIVANAI